MAKPESYPFFNIAKHHGVDYGKVLRAAHWLKNGGNLTQEIRAVREHHFLWVDIVQANDEQARVRKGYIHWLTGERLRPYDL